MDPVDQQLTDAGRAWRDRQPGLPDLDRMVARLEPARGVGRSSRFALLAAAGLALAIGVALGPAIAERLPGGTGAGAPPSSGPVSPSPTPAPTRTPEASPTPSAVAPNDGDVARDLVDRYVAALVAGSYATAFDLLASTSPTRTQGLDAYAAERAPYFASVDGRYVLGAPSRDLSGWDSYGPLVEGADRARAWLVEVDYPALAGNNAGYEQFVVAPDGDGVWRIWPVR